MPVSALTIWNISESEPKKKQATQPEGLLCWASRFMKKTAE